MRSFAQRGEDESAAEIFDVIGQGGRFCCEFGAWDGIHLSNTRRFVLDGWAALLIEGSEDRFRELQANYADNASVTCERALVDASGPNSLAAIMERRGMADRRIDLLSIDIDGLDYEIFASVGGLRHRPRLIIVEVNGEHGPDRTELLPRHIAKNNNGQPLAAFVNAGESLGYRLISYQTGNAFFLADDQGAHDTLPTISPRKAWDSWYNDLSKLHADYCYQRNLGMHGDYRFNNPRLTAAALEIPLARRAKLARKRYARRLRLAVRSLRTRQPS